MNSNNLYDIFNIISAKNNRILIIGSSGTGKTQKAFQLIFDLPQIHEKLRRIIFVCGGKCLLKDYLIPKLIKNGIECETISIENKKDLEQLSLSDLGYSDLLFIDDLSNFLADRSKDLSRFLNKAFTTSRNGLYDIIAIFHSYKLYNTLSRANTSLLIFLKPPKEIKEEFKEYIIKDTDPLIFDVTKGYKQIEYIGSEAAASEALAKRGEGIKYNADDLINKIKIGDASKFPIFKKKEENPVLMNIKTNQESFIKEINPKYLEYIKNKGGILSPMNNKKIKSEEKPIEIIKEIKKERKIINKGEKELGNRNINKPNKVKIKNLRLKK